MPGTVVDTGITGMNETDENPCPRRPWILVRGDRHKPSAQDLGFYLKSCEATGRVYTEECGFKRITVASVLWMD